MKRLWYKLKELWTDDYEEYDTMQLSRKDKFFLLYGAFDSYTAYQSAQRKWKITINIAE